MECNLRDPLRNNPCVSDCIVNCDCCSYSFYCIFQEAKSECRQINPVNFWVALTSPYDQVHPGISKILVYCSIEICILISNNQNFRI